MSAKEMMKKERFYKMEESHYSGGITYIKTIDKEYREISFYEGSGTIYIDKEYQEISFYEDSGTIYTVIHNLDILEDNLVNAINEQVLEIRLGGIKNE